MSTIKNTIQYLDSSKTSLNSKSQIIQNTIIIKTDTIPFIQLKNNDTKGFDYLVNMPWIIAFFIGLISVITNLVINRAQRQLNLKLIEKQLDNSIKTLKLQFNSTIATTNRQIWINSLRDNVSDYIARLVALHILIAENNGDMSKVANSIEYKEINSLRWKIILMLNSKNEQLHKSFEELIDKVFSLEKIDENYLMCLNQIKEQTREILKTEWEKIKNTNN